MNNYKFRAVVNNTRIISANDITTLKRLASRAANDNYFVCDKMTVYISPEQACNPVEVIYFYRMNKIYPDNTIIRGQWR